MIKPEVCGMAALSRPDQALEGWQGPYAGLERVERQNISVKSATCDTVTLSPFDTAWRAYSR